MSEHRPDPRVQTDLTVRIWGMGANGRPFNQNAHARNISSSGALLSGIEQELKVGDVIGVQYADRKCRCKVVWVMDTGGMQRTQAGIQLVADQDCPWKLELPPGYEEAAKGPHNRRRYARHRISFPVQVRDERVNTPMRVNATDVSGSGCYVETILPLAIGITLKVDFWLDSDHVSTSAVVRTSDPGVGMGVEFLGLPPDGQQRLQNYLEKIDPRIATAFRRLD